MAAGSPKRGSRYRVMAQRSPKELLSPLLDCRQHCWVVEIISSKYTWLKDSCLTASSVRQFVQHKNVSEHLSLQTCTGSCGHTLGMPCICYRCIRHRPQAPYGNHCAPERCAAATSSARTPGLHALCAFLPLHSPAPAML